MMQEEKLKEVEISVSRKVLVVGDNSISKAVIRELIEMGHEVTGISRKEPSRARDCFGSFNGVKAGQRAMPSEAGDCKDRAGIIAPAEIGEFEGSPGAFHARIRVEGREDLEEEAGAVILATGCDLAPPFQSWGLEESESVFSLSTLEEALKLSKDSPFLKGDSPFTTVFLCGFTHDSHPFSQRRVMEACLKLTSQGENRVICLMEHFKVADPGMERLTLEAREGGVLFVKLTGERPDIEWREERCRVSYYDESLGRNMAISPDLLVLEEEYRPPEGAAHLSEILGIHLDSHGFFQGDNVYNLPIFTNRTGIWVVGSAKGPVSLEEGLQEAKAAALEVSTLLGEGKQRVAENRVQLDRKKCTICLTCYRLCPHRAVSYVNRRPVFSDLACRACGICAAECPMDAIQIHEYGDGYLKSQIRDLDHGQSIIAFCCQNSAHEAANLAAMSGHRLPEKMKLIKVPCAGKVDGDYILSAFRSGADGVMVLACHHESCKSVNGSHMAQWRVEALHEALEESGLEKERLLFSTLGPGMMSDFVKVYQDMEKTVRSLGASPIKPC